MLTKKIITLFILVTGISGLVIIDRIQSNQQPITATNSIEIPTQQSKYTGIVAKVDKIAEQITVGIVTSKQDNSGSGVILARQGKTYYVATAGHVLERNQKYKIVAPDGETYLLDKQNIIRSDAYDLAIFSFESDRDYTVATIGNYVVADNRNQAVFVSGFANLTRNTNPQRIITGGKVFQSNNAAGLIYRNISYQGMSGGAILDREGRLVGINIGADEQLSLDDDYENLTIGFSSGIQIYEDILGFLTTQTQLKTEWLDITNNPAAEISNIEWNSITYQLLGVSIPNDNKDFVAWTNYGARQWRYERNRQAVKALEKAIAINPEFDRAYYTLGFIYWEQYQSQGAIEALETATKINPDISSYWSLLGASYGRLEEYKRWGVPPSINDYEEEISAYEEGIAVNPQDCFLYVELGLALRKVGRYEEAITAISKAIEINPNLPRLYNDRAITYASSKQHENALADYNKAISLNPLFVRAYNNRAGTYDYLQQYENALADYDKAISLDPNYASPYQNRGNTYYSLGQYNKALADYNKAISINPKFTAAYRGRSFVYQALGQHEKAETDKQSIREINPDPVKELNRNPVRELNLDPEGDAAIHYQLGINHLGSNENEEAIADFTQAISAYPQFAEAYEERGNIYHDLEQYDKAIADFTQAISHEPNYVEAYKSRARSYQYLEQYDKAIADYTQIIAIDPQFISAYQSLAYTYRNLEQYDKAIAAYTQLIEIDLESTFAYQDRAFLYKKLGQYDKAIADYTQLIEIDPDNVSAHNGRAEIYQQLAMRRLLIFVAIIVGVKLAHKYSILNTIYRKLKQ